MSQPLDALLAAIREDLKTVPEVQRVYDAVPESINEFPAIIVAAMGGRCWLASHGRSNGLAPLMCEHDIRVEVHIPRKNLAQDAATMTALADAVSLHLYSAFARDRYDGTMVVTGDPRANSSSNAFGTLDYTVGPSSWASQDTYAMLCDFKMSTEREVTP
jgi:hypothetical protein